MIRSRVSCALAAAVLVSLVDAAGDPAIASPAAEAIAQEVDIENYGHYLEDLLHTHLGDDRGFGPEHDVARDSIVATLSALGLEVQLEPFDYSGETYYNVVATQWGTDAPERIYVVGAHFDSVNNPGADDNGTGTALVLEVARVLSRHRSGRTIMYVLFDREEQGLVGSSAFVQAHADEHIVMAVTADMIGHDSGAYGVDVYGTAASSLVVNGVADAVGVYGAPLSPFVNIGTYPFSDHWSFESAGIPACVIIEWCFSCNPHYHTPTDAVDNGIEEYIFYPMVEDLLRSVVGYVVDQAQVVRLSDLDGDGVVGAGDLALLLGSWGSCADCPADLDEDGAVGAADLAVLLGSWG